MPRAIQEKTTAIHDGTLKDVLSGYLYCLNEVTDDEEILELTLGEPNSDGIRAIKLKTIKNKEVELIVHT